MPWIPPLLPAGQTGGVGVGCYFTSLAFMGVGLSSYRTSCQAPSWRQQWFIPDLSRAFSLILSLLHYIICCLALSCPFFLISLQLGTACTTPPHSNQPQTSRISPLQGEGVEMAESGLEISLTFHSFRSGSPFSSYHQTCHCWGYDAT